MRLHAALGVSRPEHVAALRVRFGGSMHDDDLAALLADPDHVHRRLERVGPETIAHIPQILVSRRAAGPSARDAETALLEAGLAFSTGDSDDLTVPDEVLAALADSATAAFCPLVGWLAWYDEDELRAMLTLAGAEPGADLDDWDLARALAELLVTDDAVGRILDTIGPAAAELAASLALLPSRIEPTTLARLATRLPGIAPDSVMAVVAELVRRGLLLDENEELGLYILPPDLAETIERVTHLRFTTRCKTLAHELVNAGVPAMHDVLPRGFGGDIHRALRRRLASLPHAPLDDAEPLDHLMVVLRIWDPELNAPGLDRAVLLDAEGPEAFARHALRTWGLALDDEFTVALVGALGGDAVTAADLLVRSLEPGDAPLERPTSIDFDRFDETDLAPWEQVLTAYRSTLVLALSALPVGHWYPVDRFAALVAPLYRWTTYVPPPIGQHPLAYPEGTLPRVPLAPSPEQQQRIADATRLLMTGLLEPIGAVRLDPSRTLFCVNSEAVRIAIEDDVIEADLADSVYDVFGSPEAWQPLPTEIGVRVNGLASLRWLGPDTVELDELAHSADIAKLALAAEPAASQTGFRFRFTRESCARYAAANVDCVELAAWLAVRTGTPALPQSLRRMLALGDTSLDLSAAGLRDEGQGIVGDLVAELIAIRGEPIPLELLEEIRSWGAPAAESLTTHLTTRVARRDFGGPELTSVCALLGELASEGSLAPLLRCLAYCEDEELEMAAAMACARFGPPAIDGLAALFSNEAAEFNKRLAAGTALSALAVLHPRAAHAAVSVLTAFTDDGEVEPDMLTLVAVRLADTGHPKAMAYIESLAERGFWDDQVMLFDEAMAVARTSPAVFGYGPWAAPLTHHDRGLPGGFVDLEPNTDEDDAEEDDGDDEPPDSEPDRS